MSYPKEPNYYCADLSPIRRTPTLEEYEKIFREAPADKTAGEASPWYLYSHDAVPLILKDNPNAKFIVCLRNPVDMLVSYFQQLRFNLYNVPQSLDVAWRDPGHWPKEGSIGVGDAAVLKPDYAGICSVGKQVERLLSVAERNSVRFILFDDFSASPRDVYEDTLGFLNVPSDNRTDFSVHNWRKTHRYPALSEFLMRPPFPFNHVKRGLVKLVRLKWKNPPSIYDNLLSKPEEKIVLSGEFREQLKRFFADDVVLLQKLTDRNLSAWLA